MILIRVACVFGVAFIASAYSLHAEAAEVGFISKISGKNALISRGEVTLKGKVQTFLETGDQIKLAEGTSLDITYLADGCVASVRGGKAVVISGTSPCAAKAAASESVTPPTQAPLNQEDARIVPAATGEETARVTEFSGPLARANLGQGLVNVSSGLPLKAGDTVFAGQSSSITLYFVTPDCYYTLQPETFLKIEAKAPCERAAPPPNASNGAGLALGAAALLAGGAGAIILVTGDGSDDEDDGGDEGSVTPN